ncbi:MAG: hypothetical protein M3P51_00220 [Chloroflexota bacterium]|nr:hypothetical protein [Chloroflexota bacterium]
MGQGVQQPNGVAVLEGAPDRGGDPGAGRSATAPYLRSGGLRESSVAGRLIDRLKQLRRIATRYENHAANHAAMLLPIGAILLGL